ncbi:MAG: ABC transporter ATP-binding protein [Acidimicrobiia bacterium]|nr:ABC transporter ATP-binding protein [bacterium]MXX01277.1 ABC transporter ATP-binding protein [Acidimicrobiia bacterium]MDE0674407.1 ABC transporter ATP-binding protein [bacterium]MXY73462.1 ABC transporter ATP-binding protein [Acidimicrobiia bacterium]MYA39956.1 ABC transporter ATP-binding protein [Acidimicrobiia bacterium]
MTGLRLSDVTVVLGETRVVDGVSLRVDRGEWLGLIGPNGAGKTTLLRAITGGATIETGEVSYGAGDLSQLGARRRARLMAVVPQHPVVPWGMAVADYVLLGRTAHMGWLGRETSHDLDVARRAVVEMGLEKLSTRRLDELSGGELQRAVLARALTQAAPLLILDEPTSSLDVGHGQQMMEMVDRLRGEQGLTVISALHDLTLAAQFCDRLVMMAGGKAILEGPPGAVITERSLRDHYGASVRVLTGPDFGVVVIPLRSDNGPGEQPASLNVGTL